MTAERDAKYFRIAATGTVTQCPALAAVFKTANLTIHHASAMKIVPALFKGRVVGALMGQPLALCGNRNLADRFAISGDVLTAAIFERQLYELAGCFIAVLDHAHHRRVYLDACGSMSMVYNAARKVAASNVDAVLGRSEYYALLDRDRVAASGAAKDGWITAGLTAHRGFSRLLANHYLDLQTFVAVRHWPAEPIAASSDDLATIQEIWTRVGGILAQTTAMGNVLFTLTGGNESRFLFSAAHARNLPFDYITIDDGAGSRDVTIARLLAKKFGLRWRTIAIVRADGDAKQDWLRVVGHSLQGANLSQHPTIDREAPATIIGGLGGEIGRAFLWRKLPSPHKIRIHPETLCWVLRLQPYPALDEALTQWVGALPAFADPVMALELAYIELRMSSWAFAQSYTNPGIQYVSPLISRANFTALLSLSPEIRRKQKFVELFLQHNDHEMLSPPINSLGPVTDLRNLFASRILRRFKR